VTEVFTTLVSTAERDDRIVGIVLGGSRGKGLATERSDFDVYVVVADDVDPKTITLDVDYRDGIDLAGVWTLGAFADYALGDSSDWNRYNFAHLTPSVDKLGLVQGLCDAKEWLPPDEARTRAELLIDVYLNYRYRAAKNHADGNMAAAGIDAAESAFAMLDFIFTSERRARPYNKFLAWELSTHPLDHDWGVAGLAATAPQLVRTADLALQSACLQAVERVARELGFDPVIDAWRPSELVLMRSASH
jgi:hypothetical protein